MLWLNLDRHYSKLIAMASFPTSSICAVQKLAQHCLQDGVQVVLAESCTGGMWSALLSSQPGASDWYLGSLVCYQKQSKVKSLHLAEGFIDRHGIVSEPVAQAMTHSLTQTYGDVLALSTTGWLNNSPDLYEAGEQYRAGQVWLGAQWPSVWGGQFLSRMLQLDRLDRDRGVLQVEVCDQAMQWVVELLDSLGADPNADPKKEGKEFS